MTELIPAEEQSNYETFRECLSEPVLRSLVAPVEKPNKKKRRHGKKGSKSKNNVKDIEVEESKKNTTNGDEQPNDAEDLGDFIEVSSQCARPYYD